jgi:Ni/Co efflux regulator RcnB
MSTRLKAITITLAVALAGSSQAIAKKPENPGNNASNGKGSPHQEAHAGNEGGFDDRGKGDRHPDIERGRDHDRDYHLADSFFNDSRRHIISDYYSREYGGQHYGGGNCPPGLAKKGNGCQPPGQAKKWRVGHPLLGDIIYHDVPSALLHQLGHTPEGHKIVRVGTDLLLISIGTGMVVDAIDDLDGIF